MFSEIANNFKLSPLPYSKSCITLHHLQKPEQKPHHHRRTSLTPYTITTTQTHCLLLTITRYHLAYSHCIPANSDHIPAGTDYIPWVCLHTCWERGRTCKGFLHIGGGEVWRKDDALLEVGNGLLQLVHQQSLLKAKPPELRHHHHCMHRIHKHTCLHTHTHTHTHIHTHAFTHTHTHTHTCIHTHTHTHTHSHTCIHTHTHTHAFTHTHTHTHTCKTQTFGIQQKQKKIQSCFCSRVWQKNTVEPAYRQMMRPLEVPSPP